MRFGLEGYPGRFVTIARRSGPEWFVASICAAGGREVQIPLDFLEDNQAYQAVIYQEQAEADEYRYRSILPPIEVHTETCAKDTIKIRLMYGGVSIHLTPRGERVKPIILGDKEDKSPKVNLSHLTQMQGLSSNPEAGLALCPRRTWHDHADSGSRSLPAEVTRSP